MSLKMNAILRVVRRLVQEWRTVWILLFGLVALLDIANCWSVVRQAWEAAIAPEETNSLIPPLDFLKHRKEDDNETCPLDGKFQEICAVSRHQLYWVGPVFGLLCIVQAIIGAHRTRQEALEMEALDIFEQKLAQLYTSTRWRQPNANYEEYQQQQLSDRIADDLLARRTLRSWTPVASTLFLWTILLPWTAFIRTDCGEQSDTALATFWISRTLQQMAVTWTFFQEALTAWAWKLALPFSLWQPRQLYRRVRTLLKWVRYFRFAGPLMRMLLKLQDQFWVFWNTHQQFWQAQAEKAKRLAHRSMLFDDIRRIESLAKLQTELAKVPSQMLHQATEVGILWKKHTEGRRLKQKLDKLKHQVQRGGPRLVPASEVYDRIVDLSQELTATVRKTLWSANLISPQTRFSVSWRIIVTLALLSEISRLCTSYQLYGRVDVTFTEMMESLLGCNDLAGSQNILTFTGRWTKTVLRKIIALHSKEPVSCASTLASHTVSSLLLKMSGAFETVIDLVCFLDIFVWFFTGELNPAGVVVPKPFFYRCILPGTLVQVLDHPTLPNVLPNLLSYSCSTASAVGYSRVIRWALAVVPAVDLLVIGPLKRHLFQHMESAEWMRYTESLAVIPAISGADIRFVVSTANLNYTQSDEPPPLIKRTEGSVRFMPFGSTGDLSRVSSTGTAPSMDDSFRFSYGLNY